MGHDASQHSFAMAKPSDHGIYNTHSVAWRWRIPATPSLDSDGEWQ